MTATYGNDAAEDGVIKVITAESAEDEAHKPAEQISESKVITAESAEDEAHKPAEQISESIELNGLQPGEWLKQLREQKSFSIEHIADRLYLDTGVVAALEAGDYAALPPPIFVRGYIRNYAKLLDVPSSDTLVGAYNAVQPDEFLPIIKNPQINYGAQVSSVNSKDWRVRIFTYVFFLAVAALFVLGGIRSFSNNPMQDDSMALPETINEGGEQSLALPRLNTEDNDTAYEPPSENGETDATETSDNVDKVTISLISTDNQDAQDTDNKPTFTAEQLHTVVVNYSMDSWTRIIDNAGEKVFEGVAKAGRSVTVTGEPPFKMRFGVVQGVTVEYKNEVIRVETHPKRSGRSVIIGDALPDTA